MSTDDLVKRSKFPTNGDAETLRKKGRWFGVKGMEKTAQDFFDAADAIERLQRELRHAPLWSQELDDERRRLVDELAARDKTIDALLTDLNEAIEDIQDWGAYASQYFQDKHDLAGCVAAHRAVLDAARSEGVKHGQAQG